jgi:hypothetical protein
VPKGTSVNEHNCSGGRRGGAPTFRRALPRRSTLALCAVAGLIAGVPPAGATLTGPGVANGHAIVVFHNIDFIAVSGYRTGEELLVQVIRNGITIGSARGDAVGTPEGAGLEVNHGLEGAPAPGDCWDGHTPDIRPGDRITVTHPDGVDEVTVDDIRFTERPFLEEGTEDVVVRGVAKRADGTPIPASDLDSAEFRDTSAFRGVPDVVEDTPDVPGGFTIRYHKPYILDRTDGRNEQARRTSLLGEGHTIGFGHLAIVPKEAMLVDGITDEPTVAVGCEDVAPTAVDAVSGTAPQHVNLAAAAAGGDLVVEGAAFNAEAVHVTVDDADAVRTDAV